MIAISYRREDSLTAAGRIYDRLEARFGKPNVFMDFDSIPPGLDFRSRIKETIERADLLIAIIGPHWFGTRSDGSRRIDEPTDFVRLEIIHALERGIPIIPVLINGASMPNPIELPAEIEALAFHQPQVLDIGVEFDHHGDRLIKSIQKLGHGGGSSASLTRRRSPLEELDRKRPAKLVTILALALLTAGVWLGAHSLKVRPPASETDQANKTLAVQEPTPGEMEPAASPTPAIAAPSTPETTPGGERLVPDQALVRQRLLKAGAPPERVLMVGDSLSVDKFGEVMGEYLVATYGAQNVALYAACGSSPEHWLRSEPTFQARCGFRQFTEERTTLIDFVDGRPPAEVATPKLEDLLEKYRPNVLMVQLGTNWMDALASGGPAQEMHIGSCLDRFLAAANGSPGTVRRIIWITPPDTSHFSARVQEIVRSIIWSRVGREHLEVIDSKVLTHYEAGKTGGDGIHYSAQASTEWAGRIIARLKRTSPLSGLYSVRP